MKSQSEARLRSIGLGPQRSVSRTSFALALPACLALITILRSSQEEIRSSPLAVSGIRTVFFLPALTLVFWANLRRVWLSKVEDLALILSLPFLRPLTLTLIAPFLRILAWLSLFSFRVGFFAAAPAGAKAMIPTATNSIATTSFLIPV